MSDSNEQAGWQAWGSRLLPVLTFLVGLGLGLVVMVALGGDDASLDVEPEPTPSASAPGGGDTVVTLPAACEAASDNITEATRLLDDVAASVRDFQPQELVDLLDQLETLDAETRKLAGQCSEFDVSQEPSEEPSSS